MAKKRKLADRDGPNAYRRPDRAGGGGGHAEPRVDPVYGQRSAIPGLDDHDDGDGTSDGTSVEAIAYLRSVRLEAQGIPNVLCAPATEPRHDDPSVTTSGLGQSRGTYIDGAYLDATYLPSDLDRHSLDNEQYDDYMDEGEDEDGDDDTFPYLIEAQRAYHNSLLSRFAAHRSSYDLNPQSEPPLDPTTHPISVNRSVSAFHESSKWIYILQNTPPRSAQLAAMSQDAVMWLLERVPSITKRRRWTDGDGRGGVVLGAWIWALLGRLEDLGTLSSEEVAIIRELGKRAASIIVGMDMARDGDGLGFDDEVSDDGGGSGPSRLDDPLALSAGSETEGINEGGADVEPNEHSGQKDDKDESDRDFDAAKERLLAAYASLVAPEDIPPRPTLPKTSNGMSDDKGRPTQEESLTATLDMILTIVGEVYGQRDLLIARDHLWERSCGSKEP